MEGVVIGAEISILSWYRVAIQKTIALIIIQIVEIVEWEDLKYGEDISEIEQQSYLHHIHLCFS